MDFELYIYDIDYTSIDIFCNFHNFYRMDVE